MTANRTVATSPPLGADRQHQGRRRRQDDRPQLSAAPGAANGPAVAVERVGEVSEAHAASFHAVRPRLFGIAYRVLRSAAGADDVVQDTWLRWQRTDRSKVSDAAAFLVTATTRLAINVAQSARARRETNIGLWLPEAVDTGADPADEAEQREALQLAVLMLLERLSPTERAAYVLREAFGYPYRQIAHVLTLSEANTRQLVTRARRHLSSERRNAVTPTGQKEFLEAFVAATQTGDVARLEQLLAKDVAICPGGGGIVDAAYTPSAGRALGTRLGVDVAA
jgi:RNA polymerase sigma-70 factor, ECF subfamily